MTASEPSRLDRLESLAETILLAIQQQQGQINDLRASVVDTVSMIGTVVNEMNDMQTEIRGMQAEVRGMQLENRRILDILLNQQQGDS